MKDAKGHGSNAKNGGYDKYGAAKPPKGWMTLSEAAAAAKDSAKKLRDPTDGVHVLHHPKIHPNAHSVAHSSVAGREIRGGAKSLREFRAPKSGVRATTKNGKY